MKRTFLPFFLPVLALALMTTGLSAADDDYILQPGDGVLVTVFEHNEVTTETQISASGEIRMPLIDSVSIGGKSVKDAVAEITNKLSQGFVNDPKVVLTVTGVGVDQAIVIGMVQRPGMVDFPANRPLDILSAIAMAGGFSQGADLNRVTIRRGDVDQTRVIAVDSRSLTGEDAAAVKLEPNDIVSVGQSFAQQVTVMGEVARPGFVAMPAGGDLNLLSAIANAGGYSEKADPANILVRRGTSVHQVNAHRLAKVDGVKPFELRPSDVVTVGRIQLHTVTLIGEVRSPSMIEIPASAGLDLIEAIALAGGYTNNANPKRVIVRRQQDEGDAKLYRVDARRLAKDPEARPFELAAGDTITIPERIF
jgi:polysaccharide export outer membrane protein